MKVRERLARVSAELARRSEVTLIIVAGTAGNPDELVGGLGAPGAVEKAVRNFMAGNPGVVVPSQYRVSSPAVVPTAERREKSKPRAARARKRPS